MKNIPLLIGTIIGTLVLIVVMAFFFSNNAPAQPGQQTNQVVDPVILEGDLRNVLGATQSAKVTIVEFSDFQCPGCRGAAPVIKNVVNKYPDQVRLVYRHFPLQSIHPFAMLAAQASEAAADFDQFFVYHDLLFERQPDWSDLRSLDAARDLFISYAEELGIDRAAFQEKIQSDEIRQRVLDDLAAGNTLGVNSTPTLYLNNQRMPAPHQLLGTVESILNSQE